MTIERLDFPNGAEFDVYKNSQKQSLELIRKYLISAKKLPEGEGFISVYQEPSSNYYLRVFENGSGALTVTPKSEEFALKDMTPDTIHVLPGGKTIKIPEDYYMIPLAGPNSNGELSFLTIIYHRETVNDIFREQIQRKNNFLL